MKTFICSVCGKERTGNVGGDKDTVSLICWSCLHNLMGVPAEDRKGLLEKMKDGNKKVIVAKFYKMGV